MARSDSRLFITPSTNIDEFIFDHLKQGSDSISVKGAKAITAYYLAEIVSQLDPKLDDPALRFAVIQSMHDLEARLNLIKSLFPALAPATLPTQPVWLSPNGFKGQGQSEPRLEIVSEPTNPERSQTRKDDVEVDDPSDRVLRPDGDVDPFDLSWSDFNMGQKESFGL